MRVENDLGLDLEAADLIWPRWRDERSCLMDHLAPLGSEFPVNAVSFENCIPVQI